MRGQLLVADLDSGSPPSQFSVWLACACGDTIVLVLPRPCLLGLGAFSSAAAYGSMTAWMYDGNGVNNDDDDAVFVLLMTMMP